MHPFDCFSRSLIHFDYGRIDPTSHILEPTVSVQSQVSSDVLSDCVGHATAVSSQKPSVTGKNGWGLDVSWFGWIADTGAQACHSPTPTKIYAVCPEDSISGHSSRRQATFESDPCQRSVFQCPRPKLVSCPSKVATSMCPQ